VVSDGSSGSARRSDVSIRSVYRARRHGRGGPSVRAGGSALAVAGRSGG
jgi:hypothetical protein